MLKFGNKEFRNLQEQVYKNMSDILFILQEEGVLNEFGIKVVGQESSAANMPTVADYKENNPDWAYGDAYAIGTESPYTLYILTRANGTHADDYWFNIGSFPVPGPQGPQGPQGEVGPQGPTGNPGANGLDAGFGTISASAETVSPTDPATVTITTSGPNTAKNISFAFEIPQGEKGEDGAGEWGEITGDISNQTDLITALQGKQNTLVSGTNIKTINNESILGSGNITIQGGKPSVEDFTAGPGIVIDEDLTHDTVSIEVDQASIPFKVDLATVAFSGSYNDLINKPSIPDISNLVTLNTEQTIAAHKIFANPVDFTTSAVKFGAGTITTIAGTIKNSESNSYGVVLPNTSSYTANRTLATTADIPSVSGTNDGTNWTSITINSDTYAIPSGAGTVTDVTVGGVSVLDGTVAKIPALFDGNYNSLTNKPDLSIYAQTADLGDCAFLDENEITIDYSQITGTPSIPTKTSDLTNDSGFITSSALSGYATESYVQGYHDSTKQDVISDLATIRSGAALGATAVQPSAIEDMATKTWVGQQGYLTSVSWSDVSGKPTFATVATSGSYNDLSNKPSIPSSTDFVDVTSNQPVDGQKTFIQRSEFMDGAIIGYISSGTYYYPAQITGYNNSLGSNMLDLRTRGNTPAYITLNDFSDGSGPSISLYGNINPVASNKFSLGNSVSKYKDLYLSGNLTDGTNSVSIANIATKAEIPTVPVTDVTLGGVSVLSSGVAVLPAYPTVPTTVSSFTNDAGYITSSALSGYVPTSRTINGNALSSNISLTASDVGAISSVTPTSETWTFTLDDDSTVTKTVVTAVTSA